MLDGKNLAGEQHEPERAAVALLELTKLRQQAENRRGRIPYGEPIPLDESGEIVGILSSGFGNEIEGGAMFERDVQVENREIEMERCMTAEAVVQHGRELVRTPVHEA